MFSVEFFQPRPGIRQAKPISSVTGLQQAFRTVIFYIDSKLSFDDRSCDRDLAPIRTACDAMPDRILHNRLQEKPGDLCLGSFRAYAQRDGKTRSKTDLFDGKIFLGDGQFFPEGHKMNFGDVEGVS